MNEHSARLRAAFRGRKQVKKPATDFLLIDVSNSFTKLAFASRSRIGRTSKIATSILTAERVTKILQGHDSATLVVSSVVPKKNRGIKRAAGNRKVIWLTSRSRLNIRIDYPNPKSIGADRLANAVAVAKLYGTPAIVIDFGTAVTFDIVAPDNAYIGGVIAPGLEAMTNFLYDRTALLPRISLREPRSAIGKSTNQAMVAGAIFGYRGLVREILQRITAEKSWKDKVRIVATGGYAKLIARKLPEVDAVHENLTLEGLRLVGCMNSPARILLRSKRERKAAEDCRSPDAGEVIAAIAEGLGLRQSSAALETRCWSGLLHRQHRRGRRFSSENLFPNGRNNLSGSPSDSSILSQHEDSKICCGFIAGFWDHCRERRRAIEFGTRSDVRQSVSRV